MLRLLMSRNARARGESSLGRTGRDVALALVSACALGACDTREGRVLPPMPTAPRTGEGRVVLVTIDGIRWQDVFDASNGEMPRLHSLMARGIAFGGDVPGCGVVRTAGHANVSLPGYLEIFTGHASACLDNGCDSPTSTVLDEAAWDGVPGVASISSWEAISRVATGGRANVFVSAGRPWPPGAPRSGPLGAAAAAGDASDPSPGVGPYRPDVHTSAIALDYLVEATPAFLHVGLGDADEWAHRDDENGYLDAVRRADALVGDVADALDTLPRLRETTTVLVTTDHGRASNSSDHGVLAPESGRTWLLAFGAGVGARGVGCAKRDITLADIAPTIRVLLGLPHDTRPGAGTPVDLSSGAD